MFRHIWLRRGRVDNDPHTVLREIDRVLATVVRRASAGLYRAAAGHGGRGARRPAQKTIGKEPASDPESLCEAVGEAARRIAGGPAAGLPGPGWKSTASACNA